jgi:hypothetical protein
MTDTLASIRKPGPGRPPRARMRVLAVIEEAVAAGEPVPTVSALARRCGLYSWRDAARIQRDLRKMGRIPA